MSIRRASAFLCCTALLAVPAGLAQTARQSSGNSAQAMQQLQQLSAERTQLQAENARLKQELEALRKERDELKAGGGPAERRLRAVQAEVARSNAEKLEASTELEQQRARMQELVEKSREIIDTLRTVEKERATLQQQFTERDRSFNVCADRNLELYKLNGELLGRLERSSSLARMEPFTQISRARLENLIEEYRYRAEEQRVAPAAPANPPASAPAKPDSP